MLNCYTLTQVRFAARSANKTARKGSATFLIALACMLSTTAVEGQSAVPWPPDTARLFTKSATIVKRTLLLNPREPSPSETKCGTIRGIGESTVWVIRKDTKSNQYYLCELATGKLSQPLPDAYEWGSFLSPDGYPVELSPNGQRLFFKAMSKDFSGQDPYFSYEIRSGRLLNLGSIYLRGLHNGQWATDTDYFLEVRDMPEWSVADAYVIDITRPNSVRHVLSSLRFHVEVRENPPRLETFDSPSNDGGMDGNRQNCKRSIYYFTTQTIKNYTYGSLCITEYGATDGIGYYRDVQAGGIAALVRYNPVTKQRAELYRGEIERIFWVSADERFAVLGLDNNGKIDNRPGYEYEGLLHHLDVSSPKLAVVNLNKGTTLFEAETTPEFVWNDYIYSPKPSAIKRLRSDILLLTYQIPAVKEPASYAYTLISLSDGRSASLPIHGDVAEQIIPGAWVLNFPDGEERSSALILYNPITGKSIPLVNAVDGYGAFVEGLKGNLLTVSVIPSDEAGSDYSKRARYVLLLPV